MKIFENKSSAINLSWLFVENSNQSFIFLIYLNFSKSLKFSEIKVMQLCLSNLVDLALSKPHYLECESFDILHILLHIVLKKLNLSDTKVKLYDELEAKAQSMMKALPADLSICFNEVNG